MNYMNWIQIRASNINGRIEDVLVVCVSFTFFSLAYIYLTVKACWMRKPHLKAKFVLLFQHVFVRSVTFVVVVVEIAFITSFDRSAGTFAVGKERAHTVGTFAGRLDFRHFGRLFG